MWVIEPLVISVEQVWSLASEEHKISLLAQNAIHFNYVLSAKRRFLHAATCQAWCLGVSLEVVRGHENLKVHRLVCHQGKHRSSSGEVKPTLMGEFTHAVLVFCFDFLSAIVFFVCALLLPHFVTGCLLCWRKSLSCKQRLHGRDGATDLHGCCCRWGLWLLVSWLILYQCFLQFLAMLSLLSCLLWNRTLCPPSLWQWKTSFVFQFQNSRGFFFLSAWYTAGPWLFGFLLLAYFNGLFSVEAWYLLFSSVRAFARSCCISGAIVFLVQQRWSWHRRKYVWPATKWTACRCCW